MTEYRHFMNEHGGPVVSSPVGGHTARGYERGHFPHFTEVQVAPLDAIVIRREELPEVKAKTSGWVEVDGYTMNGIAPPAATRAKARRYLALAEYVEQHPPVNEGRVKALADAIRTASGDFTPEGVARALIQRGWVVKDGD